MIDLCGQPRCGVRTNIRFYFRHGELHANGGSMSYESTAEPIKVGYLMDFKLPDLYPQEMKEDLSNPFDLVFGEAMEEGLIDRPIQIIYKEVEGLPKGSVKAVIDAYGDLVDEGCLAVFGPHITDNCVPTREAIEERFKVPALSVTGSDDWLGEWTFSFPQGSLTDEPIFWADLLVKGGHTEVGVLIEQSLVGDTYVKHFRNACPRRASPKRCAPCTKPSRAPWCTVALDSGSSSSTLRWSRWTGTPHGSPAPHSRTRGSTRSCGTPSWDGRASTSTTKATPSVNGSSTSTKPSTAGARSIACRWSTTTSRIRCCTPSPTRIR